MRWLSLLFAFFISCKQEHETLVAPVDYSDFTDHTVTLLDGGYDDGSRKSIGTIFIKTPPRLDTFYQWIWHSCIPNYTQYRFADKTYPQFAEDGFFWTVVPDSNYQLTIRHRPHEDIPDSLTINSIEFLIRPLRYHSDNFFKNLAHDVDFEPDSVRYLQKAIGVIKGRKFIFFAFSGQHSMLTQKPALYAYAYTFFRDRELYFLAECSALDTAGFYNDMYKSFLSIRIDEK